jgi:deazaflavin-dependent oxidoreductase (nitroreductase family)
MGKQDLSLFDCFLLRSEEVIMTRLVPKDNPGPIFKRLFKTPIFFYRIGLPIFSSFVLLLTTTGRKSGKQRCTPLEYIREKETGYPIIMAGWGGKTDWRYNIVSNPHVHVQIGHEKFAAVAEPLNDAEITERLTEAMKVNPNSAKIWSRWAGEIVSLEDPDSIERAVKYFPCFRLKPIIDPGVADQSAY